MPTRLLKDSIHQSERLNSLTDFQFRLWTNLIPYVDDYGRGDARPAIIKGICFPLRDRLTNADIDAALKALAGAGCVGLYEVDGKPYLYFPRWESHQNVRNKKSRFPAPPKSSRDGEHLNTIANKCKQMQTNVPVIQSNPIQSESESEEKNISAPAREEPDAWRQLIPTLDEVRAYAVEIQSKADPDSFFHYYAAADWHDRNGDPVRNWRQKFATWNTLRQSAGDGKGRNGKNLTFYDVAERMKGDDG